MKILSYDKIASLDFKIYVYYISYVIGYRLGFNYLKARRFVDAIDVCHKVRHILTFYDFVVNVKYAWCKLSFIS